MTTHRSSGEGTPVSVQQPGDLEGRVAELEGDLRMRVDGEVRFDAGTRAAYSTDSSNYPSRSWSRARSRPGPRR